MELHDDKTKKKALKAVSNISGIEFQSVVILNSITFSLLFYAHKIKREKKSKRINLTMIFAGVESVSLDMKDQKLTLTGDIDAVQVVGKLRKLCHPKILSVGPAKEPKKEEKKKPAEEKKDQNKNSAAPGFVKVCETYHYPIMMRQPHYYYTSVEENPSACVIC